MRDARDDSDIVRDLPALPKAHLHVHLAGAMRPETLRELALRYGVPVPDHDATSVRDWSQFQARYDAARDVLRSADDVGRVVRELASDDAADGCGWLELQVDPTSYARRLGGLRAAIEAVVAAAADAPIPVRVVIASSWARPPEHAQHLARLAVDYADAGVVGFGLSNDERRGRVADFVAAFRTAGEGGLLGAPHAGFYTGADHVRDCVELLGATRIGHGTSAASHPPTMAMLAERQVALEVCPTSYPPLAVHTLEDVPVVRLLEAGVRVAIGSDDPLLFGVGLAGQYRICREVLGLDDTRLARLAVDSVEVSAAPAAVKRELAAAAAAWLDPAGAVPGAG